MRLAVIGALVLHACPAAAAATAAGASVPVGCTTPPALREKAGHDELLFGPGDGSHAAWLATITAWRSSCRRAVNYTGAIYAQGALDWTRTNFVQPQMHPYDRYFYNATLGTYTVERWLHDLDSRYGGVDSAIIWAGYPMLGIDDRNQFDMVASLPGGMRAVSTLVATLHRAGVKVLWPYLPWDLGTTPDSQARSDARRLAELIKLTGADGFNADSMKNIPEDFWVESLAAGRPAAMEAEDGPDPAAPTSLNWNTMGIGYWGGAAGHYTGGGGGDWPLAPAVDKWKWFEPRRMSVVSDRWSKNKTNALQAAWFNAVGYEAWENIWGIWNGITPRDGEALRRVAHMLRFFGRRGYTQSEDWEPHTPAVPAPPPGDNTTRTVFASRWPLPSGTLWTLVNRGADMPSTALQLELLAATYAAHTFYDCYHGTKLARGGQHVVASAGKLSLHFAIEGSGYGCVFATRNDTASDPALGHMLSTMARMTAAPLASYSSVWRSLPQTPRLPLVPTPTPTPSPPAPNSSVPMPSPPPPANRSGGTMVHIPGGPYRFQTEGLEIEARFGADVQFPWESCPSPHHDHHMSVAPFMIDKYPVTCAQYAAYLNASSYLPRDPFNWLKNWDWGHAALRRVGTPLTVPVLPHDESLHAVPVTYVSYSEAAAYCAHYGKRLPATWEWQFAAQGNTSDAFPWGPHDAPKCRPDLQSGRRIPGAAAVDAYPCGHSLLYGVGDLLGNVWQLTSAFDDAHTSAVILKGGSNYRPSCGTHCPHCLACNGITSWYFPQARNLTQHNKMMLMGDSFERAGTVGFRCVRDV